jgi:hypothetical protein
MAFGSAAGDSRSSSSHHSARESSQQAFQPRPGPANEPHLQNRQAKSTFTTNNLCCNRTIKLVLERVPDLILSPAYVSTSSLCDSTKRRPELGPLAGRKPLSCHAAQRSHAPGTPQQSERPLRADAAETSKLTRRPRLRSTPERPSPPRSLTTRSTRRLRSRWAGRDLARKDRMNREPLTGTATRRKPEAVAGAGRYASRAELSTLRGLPWRGEGVRRSTRRDEVAQAHQRCALRTRHQAPRGRGRDVDHDLRRLPGDDPVMRCAATPFV